MPRFVVIGAGAVGVTLAAQLHSARQDVVLVARGAQLEKIRGEGLRYLRPEGERILDVPVATGPEDVGLRRGDHLLFVTKSQDTEAALQQWAWQPLTGEEELVTAAEVLPVAMFQNGFANEAAALRRFQNVIGVVVVVPATYIAAGHVISRGRQPGAFWMGRYPAGTDDVVDQLALACRAAGFAVRTVSDIRTFKAGKLLVNLANALDALYPKTPLRLQAAAELEEEGRAVFAAAGFDVSHPFRAGAIDLSQVEEQIDGSDRGVEWRHSSTWQSMSRGATSVETDFLNGEIAMMGRLYGVPTPLNVALQRATMHALLSGAPVSGYDDEHLAAWFDRAHHPTTAKSVATGADHR